MSIPGSADDLTGTGYDPCRDRSYDDPGYDGHVTKDGRYLDPFNGKWYDADGKEITDDADG